MQCVGVDGVRRKPKGMPWHWQQVNFRGRERDFMFLPGAGLAVELGQGASSHRNASCMCAFSG